MELKERIKEFLTSEQTLKHVNHDQSRHGNNRVAMDELKKMGLKLKKGFVHRTLEELEGRTGGMRNYRVVLSIKSGKMRIGYEDFIAHTGLSDKRNHREIVQDFINKKTPKSKELTTDVVGIFENTNPGRDFYVGDIRNV